MNHTVHYDKCPVCNSTLITALQRVTDHSVSKETFEIWLCRDCTLKFTQDVPDAAAIHRYYQSEDYISHTNKGNSLINKMYLQIRRFTLSQKKHWIEKHTGMKSGYLLDVGAGTGAFLHFMQQAGWKISGIEPDANARTIAKETFGIALQDEAALNGLENAQFDAITMWHVLEHVHDLHGRMGFLKSLLKPGGKIFIAVPNYTASDAAHYGNFWAAYDVPRHLYHFSPQSLQKLGATHGLHIIAQHPLWFDAFYVSLLSSKYQQGKTAWISAGIAGLKSNLNTLLHPQQCSSLLYVLEVKSQN